MRISIGNSRMDKKWNLVDMELSEFRDRISTTHRMWIRRTTAMTADLAPQGIAWLIFLPESFIPCLTLTGVT